MKQLYLVQVFDFETVPALPRSSGPPRPSGKRRQRRQPRTYIKLSGQTSTKDLRSILLLHEFDSKKIFTIIKIIGRPLNLLFLTFDFFSLRASTSFQKKVNMLHQICTFLFWEQLFKRDNWIWRSFITEVDFSIPVFRCNKQHMDKMQS